MTMPSWSRTRRFDRRTQLVTLLTTPRRRRRPRAGPSRISRSPSTTRSAASTSAAITPSTSAHAASDLRAALVRDHSPDAGPARARQTPDRGRARLRSCGCPSLQSETVDYMSARTESMMALFFPRDPVLRYPRARRGGPGAVADRRRRRLRPGNGVQESMAAALPLVVLYDRNLPLPVVEETMRSRWPLYAGLATRAGSSSPGWCRTVRAAAPRGVVAGSGLVAPSDAVGLSPQPGRQRSYTPPGSRSGRVGWCSTTACRGP